MLTGSHALIGQFSLGAVMSHGGEALWCKITSPYMGQGGANHFKTQGVRKCGNMALY